MELQANDRELHKQILDIGSRADLPVEISALRVFDVVAWMEARGYLLNAE